MNEVRVENLHKRFDGVTAVNGISFTVGSGEVLGFLGPNGAGKSTTMRMITGFLAPDEGRVTVAGYDPMEDPVAARRQLGYLPEGAPLYADMTPLGLLHFVAECRGYERAERCRRIDEVTERVNIGSVMHQRIETLSKGYKRRVGLAQAILHDPDVLILDEPTDGLDPTQKIEVRNLIRTMAKDKVIILSTHILEEVDAVCTRAIIIAAGVVVADDTPQQLATRSVAHHRVVVRIASDTESAASVRDTLAAMDGVASVQVHKDRGNDAPVYWILPVQYQDSAHGTASPASNSYTEGLIHRVAEFALARRWKVLELRRGDGSLEEVFATLTRTAHEESTSRGASRARSVAV